MYYPRRDMPATTDMAVLASVSSSTLGPNGAHFHSVSSDESHPSIDFPTSSDGSVRSVRRQSGLRGTTTTTSSSRHEGDVAGVVTSASSSSVLRMPTSSSVGALHEAATRVGTGSTTNDNVQRSQHRRQFSLNFSRGKPRYASSSKASNPENSSEDEIDAVAAMDDVEYLSESDVAIATPCSDSSSNYVGVMTDCESVGTGRSRNDSESIFNRSSATGTGIADVFSGNASSDVISTVDCVFPDRASSLDLESGKKEAERGFSTSSSIRNGEDSPMASSSPPPLPPRSSAGFASKTSEATLDNDDDRMKEISASPPKIDLVDRVVEEILETEKNYVGDLLETLRQYVDPMREAVRRNRLKLTEAECSDLFGNLEQIYSFNRKFCLMLENCRRDPVEISKCFVKYRVGFDCYTHYCTNYPKSAAILAETNGVSEFVKVRQEALNHGLPLASYLLKPVQRILKYHLLLQALLDHYSTNRRGYGIVKLALETMTGIARHINETKRRRELDDKFGEIKDDLAAGWSGDLKSCGLLVLDGVFRVHGAKAMRSLFLFHKTLFVCKRKNERFLVKAVISCANLMIIESIPKEPLSFHILDYENPKNQFTVQTKSLDEKQKWSHYLKRLMLENHSTVIPSAVRSLESAQQLQQQRGRLVDPSSKTRPTLSRNFSHEEKSASVLRKSPSYQSAIELNRAYRPTSERSASSSKRPRKYRRKRRSRRSRAASSDPFADEDAMVKSNSLPNDSYLAKRNYADPHYPAFVAGSIRPSRSQFRCDSSDSEDSIINAQITSPTHRDSSSESEDEVDGSSYDGSDYLSDDFATVVSHVTPEQLKPDWPWSQHFQNSSNIALRELRHRPNYRQMADSSGTLPHAGAAAGGVSGADVPTIAKRLSWSPKTEDDSGISDQNSKGADSSRNKRVGDQRKATAGGNSYASLFSPLPYRNPQLSPSTYLFFNRKDMKPGAFHQHHRQQSRETMARRPVTIATDTIPGESLHISTDDTRTPSVRYAGNAGLLPSYRSLHQGFSPATIEADVGGSITTHFPSNGDRDFQTVSSTGCDGNVAPLHAAEAQRYLIGDPGESRNSERLAVSLAKICLQPGYPPTSSSSSPRNHESFNRDVSYHHSHQFARETTPHDYHRQQRNHRVRSDSGMYHEWGCLAGRESSTDGSAFCQCRAAEDDGFQTRIFRAVSSPGRNVSGASPYGAKDDRRISFGDGSRPVYRQRINEIASSSQGRYFRSTSHPSRSKSLDPPINGENDIKSRKRGNRSSCGSYVVDGGEGAADHFPTFSSSAAAHGNVGNDIVVGATNPNISKYRHKSESQPNFEYVTVIPESEMAKPFEIRNVYMVAPTGTKVFLENHSHLQ